MIDQQAVKVVDQTVKFYCAACESASAFPLPFDMTLPRDCLHCGARMFTPPTEAEINKRVAAMNDSRVLNWHGIDEKQPPTDKPYYAAGLHTHGWSVYRVDPARPNTALAWTSHWAPDILGLPFRA